MVPLAPEPSDEATPDAGSKARRRWIIAGVVLAMLVSVVVGAAVIPTPYVAMSPGSVRPVTEQVLVQGTPSYPPVESIAYTTVSIGDATLLEALLGWLDEDVDVLPEDDVRGGRSASENRRYNAQLMDVSKHTAIAVALEQLGYDVEIQTTGAVVRQIFQDSPAEEALELDDVVIAVDGELVDTPGEVGTLLQEGGPGAEHRLTVERPAGSDTQVEVAVSTVAAGDDPDRAIIGIYPEDRIVDFRYPIDVTIDSGKVGGPSAGLAFTLAVLDVLTPGELTGGHRVAVTGTIGLDGTVGPVGGGAQKAAAVRDADYEAFIVPTDEVEEVKRAVGDEVTVIGVGTLEEALEALDSLGGDAGSLLAAGPVDEP